MGTLCVPDDNGSEFINHVITDWYRNPACPIPCTRSRDHQKNDNCFVEQKNGAVVREYIGYDRLEGEALRDRLAAVYRPLVPLLNCFMPTMKLVSKVKVGSKEIKKHDRPRSPYQRLLESEALSPAVTAELRRLCGLYNPVRLQQACEPGRSRVAGGGRRAVLCFGEGAGGLKLLFQNEASRPSVTF